MMSNHPETEIGYFPSVFRPTDSQSSYIVDWPLSFIGIGLLPKLTTHRIRSWIPDSNNPFGISRFRIPLQW